MDSLIGPGALPAFPQATVKDGLRPKRYAVGIFLCPGTSLKSCGNTAIDRTFQPGRGINDGDFEINGADSCQSGAVQLEKPSKLPTDHAETRDGMLDVVIGVNLRDLRASFF